MPWISRIVLAVSLAVAAVAGARAYEFFTTDGGEPLRWNLTKTTMRTSTVEPDEVDGAAVPGILRQAFAAWTATGCVPTVTVAGTTDATQGTLPASTKGPADNILVFIETADQWAARRHGSKEIAVTVVANNPKTGAIVDADIEINDAGFTFSVDGAPRAGEVDLLSTLTHEVGHFYGLDHSPQRDATMYAEADLADPLGKRTLAQDDVDGVCALYAIPFPAPDDCAGGGASAPWALVVAVLALAWRARRANHETARSRRAY